MRFWSAVAFLRGGYVWNVEDDDTKNVRLEDGRWTVSQRGRLIYRQAEEAAGN